MHRRQVLAGAAGLVMGGGMLRATELQGPAAQGSDVGRALPKVAQPVQDHKCTTCGENTFGTSIEFVGTPSEAANRAVKEQKLVFVLHVSGHFEDPGVT
jgi:hypothetical protein